MNATSPVIRSQPGSSGLKELIEVILDKGMVIDAYVRVSLVGIELLTVDARVVIASVDTYIRFAEATDRLDLRRKSQAARLGDLVGGGQGDGIGNTMGEGIVDRAIERVTGRGDDDGKSDG